MSLEANAHDLFVRSLTNGDLEMGPAGWKLEAALKTNARCKKALDSGLDSVVLKYNTIAVVARRSQLEQTRMKRKKEKRGDELFRRMKHEITSICAARCCDVAFHDGSRAV
jgi:hypothetical protein